MSDLANVFRAALGAVGSGGLAAWPGPEATSTDLGSWLGALCARGRARFPSLALPDEIFVRHLAKIAAEAPAGAPPLDERSIEDLYLACACLNGVPGAAAAFDEQCEATIRAALTRAVRAPAARDEVIQELRKVILVDTPERAAKIVTYSGQAPLARWAAVAAQRLAINMARSDRTEERARNAAAAEALAPTDPEVGYIKQRYRDAFEQAMKEALATLEPRDRALLSLHLVSRMSVESIGKMHGVSQSTASRWLGQAREKMADELRRLLRERLKLTPPEVDSLAGFIASEIELSMSRLLRAP